jgi:hypothetical protein
MDENNEIIEEIRRARKEIGNEFENDPEKIFRAYKARQKKNPQKYYSGKPVKIRKSKTA